MTIEKGKCVYCRKMFNTEQKLEDHYIKEHLRLNDTICFTYESGLYLAVVKNFYRNEKEGLYFGVHVFDAIAHEQDYKEKLIQSGMNAAIRSNQIHSVFTICSKCGKVFSSLHEFAEHTAVKHTEFFKDSVPDRVYRNYKPRVLDQKYEEERTRYTYSVHSVWTDKICPRCSSVLDCNHSYAEHYVQEHMQNSCLTFIHYLTGGFYMGYMVKPSVIEGGFGDCVVWNPKNKNFMLVNFYNVKTITTGFGNFRICFRCKTLFETPTKYEDHICCDHIYCGELNRLSIYNSDRKVIHNSLFTNVQKDSKSEFKHPEPKFKINDTVLFIYGLDSSGNGIEHRGVIKAIKFHENIPFYDIQQENSVIFCYTVPEDRIMKLKTPKFKVGDSVFWSEIPFDYTGIIMEVYPHPGTVRYKINVPKINDYLIVSEDAIESKIVSNSSDAVKDHSDSSICKEVTSYLKNLKDTNLSSFSTEEDTSSITLTMTFKK